MMKPNAARGQFRIASLIQALVLLSVLFLPMRHATSQQMVVAALGAAYCLPFFMFPLYVLFDLPFRPNRGVKLGLIDYGTLYVILFSFWILYLPRDVQL